MIENELNIARYIAQFVLKHHNDSNFFQYQIPLSGQYQTTRQLQHKIHIPNEGRQPSFEVTVRFTYHVSKMENSLSLFHSFQKLPSEGFVYTWYVDKIISCEKKIGQYNQPSV